MVGSLTNPVMLRAVVVLICAVCAFLIGLVLIRRLRRNIAQEADLSETSTSLETLPLHLYSNVIQQLKQQKHELRVQSQAEQHRARITETFSQAVLSNLCSGVLVFGPNGLVKTGNPAAKEILGFASATGMSAENIFRGAVICSANDTDREAAPGVFPDDTHDEPVRLADEVDAVLHGGSRRRQVGAQYQTPAGQQRFLSVTVSPVPAEDGSLLGVACLINDLSELERIRRQQQLHGEISAEMALRLRTSLATIAGYAQQLANSRDPELARQIAADIAHEAAHLDRSIGGFLTEKRAAPGAAAARSVGK
ncbi:MAG TPA: PAS domain-containing protein [Candidatus Sulfotelmatobacter sp.]|nr:PAS domain-containing protein [Candidatus Sulfotelmatobacter sp.]